MLCLRQASQIGLANRRKALVQGLNPVEHKNSIEKNGNIASISACHLQYHVCILVQCAVEKIGSQVLQKYK